MAGRKNTKNQVTKAQAVERRRECLRLRVKGLNCVQIAAQLGIDESTAARHVREALAESIDLTKQDADAYRELELARIDSYISATETILSRFHIVVSNGKVIQMPDETGEVKPLRDDGPELAAIARLQSLSESRRKLLGLDAPTKLTDGDGNSPIKVIIGIDPEDG